MAADDYAELGTPGLRRSGGQIWEKYLPGLIGVKGRYAFRNMADNDPVVGSILYAIEKIVLRLDWRVDPASDSQADKDNAEFVQSCLDDMSDSWDSTLQNILSMLIYGWSLTEIVYKRRSGPTNKDATKRSRYTDGKIGWRKLALRGQETIWAWDYDDDGSLRGMKQIDPYGGRSETIIPIEKALLFRTSSVKGNPEGRSLLRNAYRPWFYKSRIEEIEAVGIERDLAGLPVAFIPPEYLASTATAEQQSVLSAVQQIVTNIKRNEQEGVVFPSVYDDKGNKVFDLTLLSSGGSRQFDTDKIVARYDQRIAMSVLSDFILLGHEAVGSFALGTSKMDLWSMSVDAIAHSIAEVMNTFAIPRLLLLNGINAEEQPTLAYGDVANVNLKELADFIHRSIAAGAITPDPTLEDYLREISHLPPAEHQADAMPASPPIPTKPGTEPNPPKPDKTQSAADQQVAPPDQPTTPTQKASPWESPGFINGASDPLTHSGITKYNHQHDSRGRFTSGSDNALSSNIANDILHQVRENGGLSINMVTGELPTGGYMVARDSSKYGKVVSAADFYDPAKGPQLLAEHLKANKASLGSGKAYLGVWHQTSAMADGKEVALDFKDQRVHLDVTDNVQSKDKALSLGRRRDQISVWDVANFDEIQTGGQGGQVSKNGTVERGGDTETVGRYERRGNRRLGTDSVGKDDGSDGSLTKFNAHHDSAGRFASHSGSGAATPADKIAAAEQSGEPMGLGYPTSPELQKAFDATNPNDGTAVIRLEAAAQNFAMRNGMDEY